MIRIFLLALALFVPSVASAQTATPSETQLRYNNEGVLKMQENDYEGAVARFQSSLAVGDLNITYLNLGRSFFRLGRCVEAAEAFDSVEDAPKVPAPSPAEIKTALQNFRNDLNELCTAEIVFVCDEPSRVGVDKSKPRTCDGELAWTVPAGEHEAIRYDVDVSETVTVSDGESARVELTAPEPTDTVAVGGEEGTGDGGGDVSKAAPPVEKGMSTKDIFGWFALGSGAVIGLTAVVVDLAIVGAAVDDVENAQTEQDYGRELQELEDVQGLNQIVIGSAVALGVVGITLLLWPDEQDPSTVWVIPAASSDSVGAAAGFRW